MLTTRDTRNSRDAKKSGDVNNIKETRNIRNTSSRRDVNNSRNGGNSRALNQSRDSMDVNNNRTTAAAETLVKAGIQGRQQQYINSSGRDARNSRDQDNSCVISNAADITSATAG
jgi:hypothetical protein